MLKKFVTLFGGDPNKKAIGKSNETVDLINSLEASFEALSDEALLAKTAEFRSRLADGETLDGLLPEAFAAVREASKRTNGQRHYDVQLIGGISLHQTKIAEMRTGEGKTLVATLPLYLNALTGRGTHLVTVNDYLARRDARWMAPIYNALGLSVGVLQMAARTENGKKAFIVDLEKVSPHEDQHQLRLVPRAEAYAADITYGINSEFGFDYLRDNMTMRLEDRVQRGHYYAIVDEVDNILIDEARTPLIISGPAQDDAEWYVRMAQVIRQLRSEDYELDERDRNITLTEIGEIHVEELLGTTLRDPDRPEDVTPEQARLMGFLEQALRAQFLFKRNKDYLVQTGKVVIVDEFTGRLMPGRRWSDGLHQAVEAKEGARVQAENVTYATITIQNYFRMYDKLAGMTGTALTEAEEFNKIYKLDVIAIPTNLEYQATRDGSPLVMLEAKDEQGYKYNFYARREDANKDPVYFKRKDFPDIIYRTEEVKFRAITSEILRYHTMGRPMLVGTTSVELSDHLSTRLRAEPLRKLAQVALLRKVWLEKNDREEDGRLIDELVPLNAPLDQLNVAEMRKMARELGISFNPEDPENLPRLLDILDLAPAATSRLKADLESGIAHQVLNARKHTEESQIIAGAGAFGAVTIATNMAGRGVDIKLGGELPEGVIDSVNRVLHRAGIADPYDLRHEERRQVLAALTPEQIGIYEADINSFLQYMQDMQNVKELGGLHVIGSERHEARRIDNQLRGRAARQGDPGSSRFYLSLEDELMRRFGGGQVESIMQRMKIDDAVPMEVGLVSRLVEQSQTRVEGANFDVRKHLLEYDDVLNSQRKRIYSQRDLIFTKPDLSEDVSELLGTEVNRRVPESLASDEGPWKLLAWLDQIQPPLDMGGVLFPSYTLKLLLDHLASRQKTYNSLDELRDALLGLASDALKAEDEHLLHTVNNLLENSRERLEGQVKERQEALDTFFEGLGLDEGEEAAPRSPRELLDELVGVVHINVRLNPEEMRLLRDNPDKVRDAVRAQVENAVINQSTLRLVGAVERRLEDTLNLDVAELEGDDWEKLADQVYQAVQEALRRRRERLMGTGSGVASGQLSRDIENYLSKINGPINTNHMLGLLLMMPQGSKAAFDKKTHRRIVQRTTRLAYIYLAAHLLESKDPQAVTEDVLKHLQSAQQAIQRAWGAGEFARMAQARLPDLEPQLRQTLCTLLGEETCASLQSQPLQSLSREQVIQVIDELGKRALTEVYRQLLLGVITELWVEYLTQMEALRVSIGLEAYGQRDPLVQYKSKASELFQNLLKDMRSGVIMRMFTYRPRNLSSVQSEVQRQTESDEIEISIHPSPEISELASENGDEATEQELDEGMETEPEPKEEQVVMDSNQSQMSRSQKRRRHRR
jgi:preprotein translocase subunit SecA